MNKRVLSILCAGMMAIGLAGCGAGAASGAADAAQSGFDAAAPITVVSREDGSGTRGAFIELTGVEEKTADGKKVDNTTVDATIANSTNNVMQTVAADSTAIGYISLGSLNDSVKALTVDGAAPSAATVKDGTYKLSRPFNIVTKSAISAAAQDFIDFIQSAEGQKVVDDSGYIGNDKAAAYAGGKPAGKIVVAGSSSVSPVMEKLAEAYKAVNPGAEIEVQTSDSTTGVNAAIEGSCDIGMASRDLKDSETSQGVTATAIAMDGIAMIVNNANPLTGLTAAQIRDIYTGATASWADVQ